MPAPSTNVVVDEQSRTVTLQQEVYTLGEGHFWKGYHHVIYATTLHIGRGFRNPGCDLTLYCAQLVVEPGGAELDLSGEAGQSHAPGGARHALGYRDGTRNGEDGGSGADGGDGGCGGHLTLLVGRARGGPLVLKSRGGDGGRAQDGGNGKDGAQPAERAKPPTPKKVKAGHDWNPTGSRGTKGTVYEWDESARTIGEQRTWEALVGKLLVTPAAAVGLDGGNGGNAGLAGRPGEGGRGGRLHLAAQGSAPSVARHEIDGGNPGAVARHGEPGKAAAAGLGAKYLYWAHAGAVQIGWSAFDEDPRWDEHWNSRHSKAFALFKVDHFADLNVDDHYIEHHDGEKKLRLRASPGRAGKAGGYGPAASPQAPAVSSALAGAAGSFTRERLDPSGSAFREIPLAYLRLLQRSAASAPLNGERESAADSLRWLLLLTTAHRNGSDERARLYLEAESALLTLNREADRPSEPPHCIYTDIERYADFVEQQLGHISRREAHLAAYRRATDQQQVERTTLESAIAELRSQLEHLAGSPATPGSIAYFIERERQIKAGIGELDLQVLDYADALGQMPGQLQEEVDAKLRAQSQVTLWEVLQFVGMAAGVAVNFASAIGSISTLLTKVKEFYQEALDLTTWGEIFKEGVWNREFTDMKTDLGTLLDTKEWQGASKETKAFIASASDFWGKVEAYQALSNRSKTVDFQLDRLDVQASVLIFDTAKLNLKKQRNAFEAFILAYLEEYKMAREWKHLFADYFDSADTRFDLLAHLAQAQAQRRELLYQQGVASRNLELLEARLNRLAADPDGFFADDVRGSLEANLNLALGQGLARIADEARAFRLWTLEEPTLPRVPANLTAERLRSELHEPLWERIKDRLSSGRPPAFRDLSANPHLWHREHHPELFDRLARTGRVNLEVTLDPDSNLWFERLVEARAFLRGAKATAGSDFYCVLRHNGISQFARADGSLVTGHQPPRAVEFSYRLVNGEPDYHHSGAIEGVFDERSGQSRIRYSPYTTWELRLIPDYRQDRHAPILNQGLDLSGVEAIELRFAVYFNSRHVLRRTLTGGAMPLGMG